MENKLNNTTGYNPRYSNNIGTANEQGFYETSALKNNLSDLIKNNEILINELIYLTQDLYISEEIIVEE